MPPPSVPVLPFEVMVRGRPVQILETPGQVTMLNEQFTNWRLIYLDAKHDSDPDPSFFGDSVGHWEGDALVVDVTNFNSKGVYRGSGSGLHLIERYKRTPDGGLRYEVTLEDPDTWPRTWTAALDLRPQQAGMFEYACHEGNYAMKNMLTASRAAEAPAAAR